MLYLGLNILLNFSHGQKDLALKERNIQLDRYYERCLLVRYLFTNIAFVLQMCQPQERKTPLFQQPMRLWLAH